MDAFDPPDPRPSIAWKRQDLLARARLEAPGEPMEPAPRPEPEPRGDSEAIAEAGPGPLSIVDRLLRGRIDGAKAGRHQSGPAPFGYRRDSKTRTLAVDEQESEVVKLIFREYLRLRSMKRLIRKLTELGLRTRRGSGWSRAGVAWILRNDTYIGRVHFGEIDRKGLHQPIIAPVIFHKVGLLVHANNKRKVAGPCPHGIDPATKCRVCRLTRNKAWRAARQVGGD